MDATQLLTCFEGVGIFSSCFPPLPPSQRYGQSTFELENIAEVRQGSLTLGESALNVELGNQSHYEKEEIISKVADILNLVLVCFLLS